MSDPLTKHLAQPDAPAKTRKRRKKAILTMQDTEVGDVVEIRATCIVVWDRDKYGKHCMLMVDGKRTNESITVPNEVAAKEVKQ